MLCKTAVHKRELKKRAGFEWRRHRQTKETEQIGFTYGTPRQSSTLLLDVLVKKSQYALVQKSRFDPELGSGYSLSVTCASMSEVARIRVTVTFALPLLLR